jgi:CRP/FNR family transcriptional regulator, cyclic AMP receptor protein
MTFSSDVAALLRRNRLLGELDDAQMAEFVALGRVQKFAVNAPVFEKGDPGDFMFAILGGQIAIHTSSAAGKVMLLNILDPGDVVGEIALIDGKARTAAASTLRPAELFRVDRASFVPFLERHPKLCIRLMSVLCERLRWVSENIEDTVFNDVPRRLARRLLLLADTYGQPTRTGGVRILQPLSQEALASMLGVTREMVNKCLKALKTANAITYTKGFIVLTDVEAIQEMSGETRASRKSPREEGC